MTDIVERLMDDDVSLYRLPKLLTDAAEEIERLRANNALLGQRVNHLERSLRKYACECENGCEDGEHCGREARESLWPMGWRPKTV